MQRPKKNLGPLYRKNMVDWLSSNLYMLGILKYWLRYILRLTLTIILISMMRNTNESKYEYIFQFILTFMSISFLVKSRKYINTGILIVKRLECMLSHYSIPLQFVLEVTALLFVVEVT